MLERGFWTIGSWRGALIRIHWTTPLGAFLFGGTGFAPGAWVAFVLLVLCHELGHAVLVVRMGLRPIAIDVHGFGGMCRYAGDPTRRQAAIIAWGGVLAQAIVFAAATATLQVVPYPASRFWSDFVDVLLGTNLALIALNLLPFPPLDGAEAWMLLRTLRFPRSPKKTRPPDIDREVRRALEKARQDAMRDREKLH